MTKKHLGEFALANNSQQHEIDLTIYLSVCMQINKGSKELSRTLKGSKGVSRGLKGSQGVSRGLKGSFQQS